MTLGNSRLLTHGCFGYFLTARNKSLLTHKTFLRLISNTPITATAAAMGVMRQTFNQTWSSPPMCQRGPLILTRH
jgi:hypothetical protein